ncbi:Aste57867_8696 [Aphanomyces stellatus]|uniref:Aste57867_8696 protein n=1 Tax=Aphanomyces stellatus TaxID=120398 RepID=A0A485KKY8_9STRA|nr:hypothetical protein As57867_008662 [Aphanomyces stellatus]VFT85582.1 Aste57867_8696 [Aphanomyces stellatus]
MKKTSEWRLQQCRTNQRRYRQQAVEGLRQLEEQVASLNMETARLEGNLHILRSTSLMASAGAKILTRYNDMFRHGLSRQNEGPQVLLLESIMDANVVVHGDFTGGVHAIIEQWRRYASCFHTLELVQTHMDVIQLDAAQLVHSSGYALLRISRRTLETIFPHVLHREDLVQRLIGRELKVWFARNYTVDGASGRIVDVAGSVGFMNGLIDLLQSTEDAMDVFSLANIDAWGRLYKEEP